MSEYPEHDKLKKVQKESQAIGEFIENAGYTLCEFKEAPGVSRWIDPATGDHLGFLDDDAVENPDWYPEGYYAVHRSIQDILADWFGIDLHKLEEEKRAMLEKVRSA